MEGHSKQSRPGGRTAEVSRQIFAATLAILLEGGVSAVTFQDVAERARVARATLYRRWPSPAAMIADAISASAAENIVMSDTGTLRGDLHSILRQIAEFIGGPVGRAALAAGLTLQQPASAANSDFSRWRLRWADVAPVFQRAVCRGEIRSDADAEALFAALGGALYFRLLVMGAAPDEAWIERVLRALDVAGG